jgi:uncharacterized pyridoxamine 5'-phosphate oxidase family protein
MKFCRQQAEVIRNHENYHVRTIGQGEPRHRKYQRLELCGGQVYDVQVTKFPMQHQTVNTIRFAMPGLTEDLYMEHKEELSVTCYMLRMD